MVQQYINGSNFTTKHVSLLHLQEEDFTNFHQSRFD